MYVPMSDKHVVSKPKPKPTPSPSISESTSSTAIAESQASSIHSGSKMFSSLKDRFPKGKRTSSIGSSDNLDLTRSSSLASSRLNSDSASRRSKIDYGMSFREAISSSMEGKFLMKGNDKAVNLQNHPSSLRPTASHSHNLPPHFGMGSPMESERAAAVSSSSTPNGQALNPGRVVIQPAQPTMPVNGLTDRSTGDAHQSFVTRSIDILVEQYPSIAVELSLLKRAIQEHERAMESTKHSIVVELEKKLWQEMVRNDTLEKDIHVKAELIDTYWVKIDILERNNEKLDEDVSLAQGRTEALEMEMQRKDDFADLQREAHLSEAALLEREKSNMMVKISRLEDQLQTVKIEVQASKRIEEQVLKANESLKADVEFYRGYYEKQEDLYSKYFDHKPNDVNMVDGRGYISPLAASLKPIPVEDRAISESASRHLADRGRSSTPSTEDSN